MVDRNLPRAFEEYAAKALGLTSLRAGIHELHETSGSVSTTICVDCVWTLRVIPFREQRGFITAASSRTGNGLIEWQRAVVRTGGTQVVSDITHDPVLEVLPKFDLLSMPTSDARDGISYELIVTTLAAHSTIQFSNPNTEPWISLETAAIALASRLVANCDNNALLDFVATWKRYSNRPN